MSPTHWISRRVREGEHMDDPERWESHVPGNLEELARTNRWFGGTSSLQSALKPILKLEGARILDVGTADGATLATLGRWGARQGAEWELHGLDLFSGFLELAGPAPGFFRYAGDAAALPFPDRVFDAVLCMQTLHHFDDEQAVSALRELTRVSRNLVVISDLRRSLLTYAAARGLAAVFWRNVMTRHDGPRSVQASFTSRELLTLARRASPGEEWRVRPHGPFRMVLECARTGAAS